MTSPLLPICLLAALAAPTCGAAPAGTQAVKLLVRADGCHAVTGAALRQAGVDLEQVAPDRIGVTCAGSPVGRRVVPSPDGTFGADAQVILYGQALDTRWTDTNAYFLTWNGDNVLDMPTWQPSPDPGTTAFPSTLRLEENREYAYLIWAPDLGEVDPWFWQTFRPGKAATVRFDLPHLVTDGGAARLRVMLRGRTSVPEVAPDHHVRLSLNGHSLGSVFFDGQTAHLSETDLPPELLTAAGNELTLDAPGDTDAGERDQVSLDWIEVQYPRSFECGERGLTISVPDGATGVRLTGVQSPTADLYDVTDPARPRVAVGLRAEAGVVSASLPGPGTRTVVAVANAGYPAPVVVPVANTDLRDTARGADYIVLAHDDLLDAIRPLVAHRAAQGMRVFTAPVSAVYDQFGWGVVSPHAIRDFLKHAHESWPRPAPRYVLLVGDANYDARDYLRTGTPNLIPSFQAPVFETIEMSTDRFYVDFSYGPEAMFIGRIPAQTPEQVATVVEKTIRHETAPPRQQDDRMLLLGELEKLPDGGRGGMAAPGFRETAAAMQRRLSEVTVREVLVDPTATREHTMQTARAEHTEALLKALSGEFGLVAFHGHGDRRFWGLSRVLQLSDVASLTPTDVAPVVLNVSCFTGEFDSPHGQSTGEALLFAPHSGATAFVGPTRLGGFPFTRDSFRLAPGDEAMTLGEFVYCGKWDLHWEGRRHPAVTFATLGDPALRLRFRLRPVPHEQPPADAQPVPDEPRP